MASPYLTAAEVAGELGVTTSGVYKLVKRGKLPAVKLSERGMRISRLALEAYQRRLQHGGPNTPSPNYSTKSLDEVRTEFEAEVGMSPAEWERRWRNEQIEDSAENMRLTLRAMSLLLHGDRSDWHALDTGGASVPVPREAAA